MVSCGMPAHDARSLAPAAQEVLRQRAVAAVLTEGRTQVEAAHLFGVTRQAVGKWIATARTHGRRALRARRRGRPPRSGARLTPPQATEIRRLLRHRMPDQLALPFYLWTREAVQRLIQQRTGVRLSRTSVGRYLAAWHFTPQKPVRRAVERNPVAVKRWLTTEYPAIAARAKRQRAAIYWIDEMGVRSDDVVGRSYAPRGRTPVVVGTGQRFSCHMISGITNRGTLAFMTYTGSFNQTVLLRFFRRLVRQADRKVVVIMDGHPVHRGKRVAAWVAKHRTQLEVYFLPGYSPELNPDELLNQDTKQVTGRQRPRTQPQLRQTMHSHLRRRQRQPVIVRRFFQHPDTSYAA